jgi:hypothetical protein
LHYKYDNSRRIRQSLFMTPAIQAGLTSRVWDIKDLAVLVEERETQAIEEGSLKRGKYLNKN